MAERPIYIIDASIVVRWYLSNPPYAELASRVRDNYVSGQISLGAPDNLRVEVGGAIHQAVLARALRASEGEARYESFLDLAIPTVATTELLLPAYRLSIRYGCGFYDAIYLALAEAENAPFLHADRRLHHALGGRFERQLWIEDAP